MEPNILTITSYAGPVSDGSWALVLAFRGVEDEDEARRLYEIVRSFLERDESTVH